MTFGEPMTNEREGIAGRHGASDRIEHAATPQDWDRIGRELDAWGYAVVKDLIDADNCAELIESYQDEERFRSHVVMRRHGFGEGEYKYFAYPLPSPIEQLRRSIYPGLAPIANRWIEAMGLAHRYPERLDHFLAHCHDLGQRRSTPLLLKYREGDYNCLHQDI